MKKIFSLLFVFLLIFSSVPLIFAQDVDDSDSNIRDESRTGVQRLDRDLRTAQDRAQESVRKTLRALQAQNVATTIKVIAKREADELRERLRECKEGDSQDCKDLRKEAKLRAKQSMARITERVLNVLNKLKERIENSDFENKDNALEEINAAVAKIEETKANIMELTGESSKEDIKAAIGELKTALREAIELINQYHHKANITKQRIGNAIERFKNLVDKFIDRLNKFEGRGYDFSDLKAKLDLVQENVDTAEGYYNENKLEDALVELREAHKLLLEALREFNARLPSDNESDDECTTDADCEEGEFCDEGECEDLEEEEENDDENETEDEDDDEDEEGDDNE